MSGLCAFDFFHTNFEYDTVWFTVRSSRSSNKAFFFLILIIIKNTHKGQKVLTFNDIAQAT